MQAEQNRISIYLRSLIRSEETASTGRSQGHFEDVVQILWSLSFHIKGQECIDPGEEREVFFT